MVQDCGIISRCAELFFYEPLADTGAGWISILATWYQDTVTSTEIYSHAQKTPTDAGLIRAIQTAHDLGLKVMLKPHLDLFSDPAHWRGQIGEQFTTTEQWNAWFASYQAFINHYARLAAANGVEQLCIGTELDGTAIKEQQWRTVIAGVKQIYSGPLVYAANHTYTNVVMFWDALDYIGIDAYYVLATTTTATLDDFVVGWAAPVAFLDDLAVDWQKPIIFTEIGYRSIDGAGMAPWAYEGNPALDLQEQADLYQAFFETVYPQEWFAGVFWWSWDTNPMQGGPCDRGYSPLDKPAEDVLRVFFGGEPKETGGGLNPRPNTAIVRDIYIDDDLAHAPNWSWGWWSSTWHNSTLTFNATDEVFAGQSSIRAYLTGPNWGAGQFGGWGTPLIAGLNYGLEFYIKQENLDHGLRVIFDGGNPLDYCRYTVGQENGWSHVRIPFVDANWDDEDLTQKAFAIQTKGNDTTFWLDNMRVLGAIPVELSDGYNQNAKVGETVVYNHVLKSYDSEVATFALEAMSSRHWPIELVVGDGGSTYTGPFQLGPGMTTTVQIKLTVPLTETVGVNDTTTLTASKVETIILYSDTLADITTVIPTIRYIYLPLVMRNY